MGLVLGTAKYRVGGGINLFYKYRIEAITQLYHEGKIQHILVSGDNSTHRYNEPSTILKDLLSNRIPRHSITLDYAGFRTWDSVIQAHQICVY